MARPPLLIVNADDFGLTAGLCEAVLRAAACGIVTSTSALANGAALVASAPALRDSGMGVGAHLALVGHQGPVLSAREVPTLVDDRGRLARGWRPFLTSCALGRVDPDDVRREFAAQLDVLRGLDLTLTHLDTHQNLHLWPGIARVTVGLAAEHDLAVRVTRTAGWSPIALAVRYFSARLEHRADAAGVRHPDATAGFDEAGRLDLGRLERALQRFAVQGAASAELVCHPNVGGDPDLDALGWSYRGPDELDALVSPAARDAVQRSGYRLGTFADLAPENRACRETPR